MQENPQKVYAIVLRYPESNKINLYAIKDFVTDKTKVKLLGYKKDIKVGELIKFDINRHIYTHFLISFLSYVRWFDRLAMWHWSSLRHFIATKSAILRGLSSFLTKGSYIIKESDTTIWI